MLLSCWIASSRLDHATRMRSDMVLRSACAVEATMSPRRASSGSTRATASSCLMGRSAPNPCCCRRSFSCATRRRPSAICALVPCGAAGRAPVVSRARICFALGHRKSLPGHGRGRWQASRGCQLGVTIGREREHARQRKAFTWTLRRYSDVLPPRWLVSRHSRRGGASRLAQSQERR